MPSPQELQTLTDYLTLSPDQEVTFTCTELLGYIFGLAITPDILPTDEWQPLIFGGDPDAIPRSEEAQMMFHTLKKVLNRAVEDFHKGQLRFPFDLNDLTTTGLEQVYEWVSGFEEALALTEERWDPEHHPMLSQREKEELYHSLITIQGLVDPVEVSDYFDNIPDHIFNETFVETDDFPRDREAQVQFFLLANLPLAVETLMGHSKQITSIKGKAKGDVASKSGKIIEVDFKKTKPEES